MKFLKCIPPSLLILCTLLAACGSEEEASPGDGTSGTDTGSEHEDSNETPDVSADATLNTPEPDAAPPADVSEESCESGADTSPPVLWIGPDSVGPCDEPCYDTKYGAIWNDEEECLIGVDELMCWRTETCGMAPTCYVVPDVGLIVTDYCGSLISEYEQVDCPPGGLSYCEPD
jgi:hypothetical protein